MAAERSVSESVAQPDGQDKGKNPAAVALGRFGGLKSGKARAKNLTKQQRSNIAKKAARAGWASKKKDDDGP